MKLSELILPLGFWILFVPASQAETTKQESIRQCVGAHAKTAADEARVIDCADLALEGLATCAAEKSQALALRVWDASSKKYSWIESNKYGATADFIAKIKSDMGVQSIYDQSVNVTFLPYTSARPGDLLMYAASGTGFTGHVMIITKVDHSDAVFQIAEGHIGGGTANTGCYYYRKERPKDGCHFVDQPQTFKPPRPTVYMGSVARWNWEKIAR